MARAGISTAPFAVQHGENARIVSVLRFPLLRGSGGKGKAQRDTQGKPQTEIARRDADCSAEDQTKRKTTVDHRDNLSICKVLYGSGTVDAIRDWRMTMGRTV